MNMLNITISGSNILIIFLILVIMAIIGYYADKTVYSKDYKKKNKNRKEKKINLTDARLNDLVGAKKEDNLLHEQKESKDLTRENDAQTMIVKDTLKESILNKNAVKENENFIMKEQKVKNKQNNLNVAHQESPFPNIEKAEVSKKTIDDFQMEEALEKKLKENILESIRLAEAETPNIIDKSKSENFKKKNNMMNENDLSLDDDLGIIELPKLKTSKEIVDIDALAVDDIFDI